MYHQYRLFVCISINILCFNTFHHSSFYNHNNYKKYVTSLKESFLDKIVTKFGPKGFGKRFDEAQIVKTEDELLIKWKEFVCSSDPDVLTGYNICNFDLRK